MTDSEPWGAVGGEEVQRLTLASGPLRARLATWGARVTELWLPDVRGDLADVVLGHDTLADYMASPAYFGCVVGRFANRIARGRLPVAGRDHALDINDGRNHLHGGSEGFDRKVWRLVDASATWATLALESPDGDMGYPGAVAAEVTYELTDDSLRVGFRATCDRPTVVSLAHHGYWNLAGTGDILGHELALAAPFYTPVDGELIPTGEVLSVADTAFDFRAPKPIGRDIAAVPGGYDHNFALGGAGEDRREAARLADPASGRWLALETSAPGLQVYAGGSLPAGLPGKRGAVLGPHAGIALESQAFPASPGFAHFPGARLEPGETYRHEMTFRFGAR